MPATDLPVRVELVKRLPAFRNPHGVPEVSLPANARGLLVEPQPGATVGESVLVRGFASELFEGAVNVRAVSLHGETLAEAAGIWGGGMGADWGSFSIPLALARVPTGDFWLELGDCNMRDGDWNLMDRRLVTRK